MSVKRKAADMNFRSGIMDLEDCFKIWADRIKEFIRAEVREQLRVDPFKKLKDHEERIIKLEREKKDKKVNHYEQGN